MLMGLAQGKLVVCLEVLDTQIASSALSIGIDFVLGWLQSHFDFEISLGSHADPHWRRARPFTTCSTYRGGD